MKAICLWLVLVLASPIVSLQAQSSNSLRVVSFNLRFAGTNKPNSWAERRPVMKECIANLAPDIMGTQEGVYYQLKDIASDMPGYEWLGLGREGGSRGEFMAIFYRKERFEPMAYDHFWLSDTPDVIGSSSWGNTVRRMVTWVRFRDRQNGKEFYFVNTHLDHQVQPAREKGAALIRKRIEDLKTDLPVILTGDFNAKAEKNQAYKVLTADNFLQDTWKLAPERKGEGLATFNGFSPEPKKSDFRIDWILTRGAVSTKSAEVNTFSKNGQVPSDHWPIAVLLELN